MSIDLAALLRLCDAATPGPYLQCGHARGGCRCGRVYLDEHAHRLADFYHENDDERMPPDDRDKANAALFAALDPATVRALVEMAQRGQALEASLNDLTQVVQSMAWVGDARLTAAAILDEIAARIAEVNRAG